MKSTADANKGKIKTLETRKWKDIPYNEGILGVLVCYDLDKNLNKKINEKGPDKVAWDIANKHNTRYKNRKFIPHGSKTPITIWGGDYGWVLNQKYTAEKIREALNLGRDSEFEMKYKQEPYYKGDKNDDIGKSYIEISIGRQTLWLVKNGKSVFSTDVVTGKPNHYTPLGAYFITQKATNATLKGLNRRILARPPTRRPATTCCPPCGPRPRGPMPCSSTSGPCNESPSTPPPSPRSWPPPTVPESAKVIALDKTTFLI